jgi:hypothetical protein
MYGVVTNHLSWYIHLPYHLVAAARWKIIRALDTLIPFLTMTLTGCHWRHHDRRPVLRIIVLKILIGILGRGSHLRMDCSIRLPNTGTAARVVRLHTYVLDQLHTVTRSTDGLSAYHQILQRFRQHNGSRSMTTEGKAHQSTQATTTAETPHARKNPKTTEDDPHAEHQSTRTYVLLAQHP